MTKPRSIPALEWDLRKDQICTLYREEEKTLKELVELMGENHGFYATPSQYTRQFRKWGLKKNATREAWEFARLQVKKRELEGKDTEIRMNNRPVPAKKLKKAILRYTGQASRASQDLGEVVNAPGIVIARTPSPTPLAEIDYFHLPWFQFQDLIELSVGHSLNLGAPSQLMTLPFGSLRPAQLNPTPYVNQPGFHDFPFDTMVPDPIYGMFGLDLGDEQSLDLSQVLPGAKQTTSSAQRETIREARKLLGECLGQDAVDPDSPEQMSRISSTLDDIMVEKDDGDIGRHVRNFYSTSGHDIHFQLLRYIAYLSTNNLLADSKLDNIVLWLIENGKFWTLTYLVDIKSPTTEILASNVFLSAARIQSEVAIRTLLASGINPNVIAGFDEKRTALQVATVKSNTSLVRLLLDAGADPNVNYEIDGMAQSTALADALVERLPSYNLAELLIKHGADVNTVTCDGRVPLILAVQTQNVDLVRAVLSAGARVNFVTAMGTTALQLAAYYGTPEIVEALVSAGADVDYPSENPCKRVGRRAEKGRDYWVFNPPLQIATERDNVEMTQILLEAGANVNGFPGGKYFSRWLNHTQADNGGGVGNADIGNDSSTDSPYEDDFWECCGEEDGSGILGTALQEAVLNNNMVLARLFMSLRADVDVMGSQGTALQIACRDPAKIKLVKLLLQRGADVNSVSQKWHSTALVGAAKSGDEGLVKTLLDANADPNAPTYDGETPLHAAIGSGNAGLVRLLINAGAHVNIRPTPNGLPTLLHAAVKSGNIGSVRLLINAGGIVNTRPVSKKGRTCLQIACNEADTQMFNYLLELGADVNDCTSRVYGYTALQAATAYFFLDDDKKTEERAYMVRKLLEHGADPNTPGPTCPLSEAIRHEQYELAQVLLDKGAHPNGQRYCREPLQWAVERESVDMARHLLSLGADANRCFKGEMPLSTGASRGNLELVKLLVDVGGAKITGMNGTRALINAVKADSIDVVRFFFERGVCPNLPRESEEKSAVLTAVQLPN